MDAIRTNHLPRGSRRMDDRTNEYNSENEMSKAEDVQYDHTGCINDQDDETAEKAIDKDLKWTARKPNVERKFTPLEQSVLIPQVAPGLASLFRRAWAPDLLRYDVQPEEWMQFVDHLNICKAASPPLQALNLAGSIVGLVPVHYAALAGMATNVVATGGMVAVARVRISRYLKRANAEYFMPRGLVARIVGQDNVYELTGQSRDAPMLSDIDVAGIHSSMAPDIIERRMRAFGDTVAPLQYDNLPAKQIEDSTLDQMNAKMIATKAERGMKKGANRDKMSKELAKLEEARTKRESKVAELRMKAEKEIIKKPKDKAKVQKDLEKELAKLEKDAHSDEEKYAEKLGKGGKKMDKKVERLIFIGIQDLSIYMQQQKQQQEVCI